MVLGDFNAHLGRMGGERDWVGSLSSGPEHTYISGNTCSVIDYVFADIYATSLVNRCRTLPMEDLNTSDHLPIVVDMNYSSRQLHSPDVPSKHKIDWIARSSGLINSFSHEIKKCITPLLKDCCTSVQQVNEEIQSVAKLLRDKAQDILPTVQPKGVKHLKDSTLASFCSQSKAAREKWKKAGRPHEGKLFDEKCQLRRAVRRRIRFCAAQKERNQIRRREKMFMARENMRFRLPGRRTKVSHRLKVGDAIISDPNDVDEAWVNHFGELAESKIYSHLTQDDQHSLTELLTLQSLRISSGHLIYCGGSTICCESAQEK